MIITVIINIILLFIRFINYLYMYCLFFHKGYSKRDLKYYIYPREMSADSEIKKGKLLEKIRANQNVGYPQCRHYYI